jgi:hypothetical protein
VFACWKFVTNYTKSLLRWRHKHLTYHPKIGN